MFEFEEKENFSLEEVKELATKWKSEVEETISTKDAEITGLQSKVENVEELQKSSHELQVKNLMLENGLDSDVFDLVFDKDIENVKTKIEKVKAITKEKEIDNSFKPEKKRKSEDQYEKALKNGNVEGALKHKLGKLFA